MNVSQSVPSSIEGVSFQSLSSDEVKRISVKRITNPIALDSLLHPIPGGLHDLALGAFMDNPCATCNLSIHSCPGHFGHIEFPVFLYHCTFITQAFRLLRAQCAYCHKLKMPRVLVNLYWCKLRLISCGLLEQAQRVEDVGLAGGPSHSTHDSENESDDPEVSAENLIAARRKYVRQQIKSSERLVEDSQDLQHTEATSHARKQVLGELYKDMLKAPRCAACNAFSPGYRKNKQISFFRKPLSEKQLQRNIQAGVKSLPNPLTKLVKMQQEQETKLRRQQIRSRRNEQLDEGIADMEDSSRDEDLDAEILDGISDESEEPDIEQLSATDDINPGAGFIQDESQTQERHKPSNGQNQGQTREKYINANEVHAALTHLFDLEQELFNEVYNSQQSGPDRRSVSADMFFVKSLLVPPNKFRKEQKSSSSDITESQENEAYRRILANCDDLFLILEEIKGTETSTRQTVRNYNDLQAAWLRLQDTVNWLIDSDTNPSPMAKLKDAGGVKQKLEKKEGIFRMNIMGKRVNFAARTVLSPDPNIETNEIGVPPEFATKLHYPEPVTERNFEEMKKAVINGHKHPGAVAIEDERGIITSLRNKSQDERLSLANSLMAPSSADSVGTCNKKVHRHLVDGDFVLMNRQPTLHKPSIMAHRAKVLKGVRTFRMHYANCKTYNADFDGDEMNLHFPQNEMARCEAWLIADADNQYLSATAGKPLRGLVQDHISMGVWLSSLDTFFTREEYHNFIYAALRPEDGHVHHERIMTVDPAICKPKHYWTGKQLVTTILFNIKPDGREGLNMASKCGVPADRWHAGSEEGLLRVSASEVVTGTLDAKQIGASRDSLIHTVHETYGLATAGRLIGILGRLLTKMLNSKAFSCGVEDLVMTHQGESARTEQLKEADSLGVKVAANYVSLDEEHTGPSDRTLVQRLEEVLRDDDKQAGLDGRVKNQASSLSSKITRACLPNGLRKSFPENQMQTMTSSGAKGSMVNANLISCNLGQQVLEGRRVPTMVSGKTLPAFKPFESNIRAGGYIADRFLTGIRPQEYYFHTMAGREGLIDTAVKTSRSGYLQRCLIKGLESLRVDYDNTVRDADGAIIQAIYGEDGLDITKCQKIADFSHIAKNFQSFWRELDVDNDFAASASNEAAKWNEKASKQASKVGIAAELEPALSRYAPLSFAGSTSEKFLAALKTYMKQNADGLLRPKNDKTAAGIARQRFEWLQYVNYLKSLVQPGEAVGVVAGQSLGEPSTQMTLNTFHLAGHSAKNVTLGIPRLREILMTASVNLKTPTMMLWPNPELSKEQVTHFAKSLTRVSLAQIIDQVRVTERLGAGVRSYDVSLQFFDASDYREVHALTVSHVAQCLERIFIPSLRGLAKADIKRRATDKSLERVTDSDAVPEIGRSTGKVQEQPAQADADREADSDSEAGGDEDATTAKRRANMDEGQAYDDPDDEDEADLAAVSESSSESEDETYSGSPKPKSGEKRKAVSSDRQEAETNGVEQHHIETAANSAKARVQKILEANEEVSAFAFDESIGKECTFTLEYPSTAAKVLFVPMIKKAARQSLAGQHVSGVESCMVMTTEEEDPKPYLFTQGENLLAMRSYQHFIVPHTMTSNDVGAVLRIYGVEAARETIAQELHSVFDGHSIDVDRRHLTLVADYMTRAGGFKAFSRTGMVDSVSPLQKMSFETTLGFLKDAIQEGEYDNLLTPSARITVGKPGRIGTGMFDLMVPVA